jgi:hypothetical protein
MAARRPAGCTPAGGAISRHTAALQQFRESPVEEPDGNRTYFALKDEAGQAHPAMAYLAGTLDENPVFEVVPLKRFVKLIGCGEHLEALEDGRFLGLRTGRIYSIAQGLL